MLIIKDYEIRKYRKTYYIISKEKLKCPYCNNELKVRDSRKRHLILNNEKCEFNLRRLKCVNCKKIHIELPDIIIPYKRYSKEMIKSAVFYEYTNCQAENSTIYRWKNTLNNDIINKKLFD